MSKVEAYMCDYAHHLALEQGIVGIVPTEDMFDKLLSFPTTFKVTTTDIHYCTDCYRKVVLIPAGNMSSKKEDERLYALKVKELSYGLRAQTVANYKERKKNQAKSLRGK